MSNVRPLHATQAKYFLSSGIKAAIVAIAKQKIQVSELLNPVRFLTSILAMLLFYSLHLLL